MHYSIIRALALAASLQFPTSALAALIVYDDFSGPGTNPDPTKWYVIANGSNPTQSGGSVLFNSDPDITPAIRSITSFSYGTFEITIDNYGGGTGHIIGLNSQQVNIFNADDAIFVRDDGGFAIYDDGFPLIPVSSGFAPTTFPTIYTFKWMPSIIEIYKNNSLLLSSTSGIPDEPLFFELAAYNGSDAPAHFSVTSVAYEPLAAVPEPATQSLMLVGLVSFLLMGRRQDKRSAAK